MKDPKRSHCVLDAAKARYDRWFSGLTNYVASWIVKQNPEFLKTVRRLTLLGVGSADISGPCYRPKAVKGPDSKLPKNRRWIFRFNRQISWQFLFEDPDSRTSAKAPVLTHHQKPPINSCVCDENANRSSQAPSKPAASAPILRVRGRLMGLGQRKYQDQLDH